MQRLRTPESGAIRSMNDRPPELLIAVVCLTLFCLILLAAAIRQ